MNVDIFVNFNEIIQENLKRYTFFFRNWVAINPRTKNRVVAVVMLNSIHQLNYFGCWAKLIVMSERFHR